MYACVCVCVDFPTDDLCSTAITSKGMGPPAQLFPDHKWNRLTGWICKFYSFPIFKRNAYAAILYADREHAFENGVRKENYSRLVSAPSTKSLSILLRSIMLKSLLRLLLPHCRFHSVHLQIFWTPNNVRMYGCFINTFPFLNFTTVCFNLRC